MAPRQRVCALASLILILTLSVVPGVWAQNDSGLNLTSARFIVVDAETGNVFAEQGANDRVAIASVTKMFTAVQALEMASLDTVLTTSDWDLRAPEGNYFGSSGTLMGFGAGEQYTLRDLIYGMLLPSGNDAANTIARELGYQDGDTDAQATQRFMDLLNQRVEDMGLSDTFFKNPSGWGVEGHYSSAADVATFGMLAAQYPFLMDVMGTSSYTTSNGAITVTNTNRSLNQYPSVFAGKTGYDLDSGYCLINFASRDDGGTMIAVTLDGVAPGGWYNDNASLLDYGFSQRSELLATGTVFSGEVAAFTNPTPAEITRSTTSQAAFVPIVAVNDGVSDSPESPNEMREEVTPPSEADRMARPAIWVVAIGAVALVVWRGFLTLRGAPTSPRTRHTTVASDSKSGEVDSP